MNSENNVDMGTREPGITASFSTPTVQNNTEDCCMEDIQRNENYEVIEMQSVETAEAEARNLEDSSSCLHKKVTFTTRLEVDVVHQHSTTVPARVQLNEPHVSQNRNVINVQERAESDTAIVMDSTEVNGVNELHISATDSMEESHVRTVTDQTDASPSCDLINASSCHCSCHTTARVNLGFEDNEHPSRVDDTNSNNSGTNSTRELECIVDIPQDNVNQQQRHEIEIEAEVEVEAGPSSTENEEVQSHSNRFVREMSAISTTSTTSAKPPTYSSLGEYIIHDEPPKYQEITGNKLVTELELAPAQQPRASTNQSSSQMNCKSKVAGFFILFGVVLITSLLIYLSITSDSEENPR